MILTIVERNSLAVICLRTYVYYPDHPISLNKSTSPPPPLNLFLSIYHRFRPDLDISHACTGAASVSYEPHLFCFSPS